MMFSVRFLAIEESNSTVDLLEFGVEIGTTTLSPELTKPLAPVEFPQQKLELLN